MFYIFKSIDNQSTPYAHTVYEDIHYRSWTCPCCHEEANYTKHDDQRERKIKLECAAQACGYPDLLSNPPEHIVSEQVLLCFEKEGIGSFSVFSRLIASPLPNGLLEFIAPKYFSFDTDLMIGAEVDIEKSETFDFVDCKVCGHRKWKFCYPPAVKQNTLFPIVIKEESWNRSPLFSIKNSKQLFCTEAVIDCIQKHHLHNFTFVPIELGAGIGFEYDFSKPDWRAGLHNAVKKYKERFQFRAGDPELVPHRMFNQSYQLAAASLHFQAKKCGQPFCDGRAEFGIKRSNTQKDLFQRTEGKKAGDALVLSLEKTEMRFRWCPPGKFMMGSPQNEKGRYFDETQHEVTLTNGFWILETPITQVIWSELMTANPSFRHEDCLPVDSVSWFDCQEFIKTLHRFFSAKNLFFLPTEAEWEYACRAGKKGPFAGSTRPARIGWYSYWNIKEKTLFYTTYVGQKNANNWGIYDMLGNVNEWCADWYAPYMTDAVTDPIGPKTGTERVYRGGSCRCAAIFGRAGTRNRLPPDYVHKDRGFRIVFKECNERQQEK